MVCGSVRAAIASAAGSAEESPEELSESLLEVVLLPLWESVVELVVSELPQAERLDTVIRAAARAIAMRFFIRVHPFCIIVQKIHPNILLAVYIIALHIENVNHLAAD